MKRTLVMLMLCALAAPCLAGIQAKSEVTLGASFVKSKDGGSDYAAAGTLLVPVFKGKFLLGPAATLSSSEYARSVGIRGEVPVQLFYFGAEYAYFLTDVSGKDRGAASAFAGLKSKGPAFIKVEAQRVFQGRGKDLADYSAVAAIGKRW